MQKYIMFDKVPDGAMIMYPSGIIKMKDEVKVDYPILNTPMGVIGITTDNGELTNPVLMGSYDNIFTLKSTYASQGAPITEGMVYDVICEVITEFVNTPTVDEEEAALDAYFNMEIPADDEPDNEEVVE